VSNLVSLHVHATEPPGGVDTPRPGRVEAFFMPVSPFWSLFCFCFCPLCLFPHSVHIRHPHPTRGAVKKSAPKARQWPVCVSSVSSESLGCLSVSPRPAAFPNSGNAPRALRFMGSCFFWVFFLLFVPFVLLLFSFCSAHSSLFLAQPSTSPWTPLAGFQFSFLFLLTISVNLSYWRW
jgi:hypothetical protein